MWCSGGVGGSGEGEVVEGGEGGVGLGGVCLGVRGVVGCFVGLLLFLVLFQFLV